MADTLTPADTNFINTYPLYSRDREAFMDNLYADVRLYVRTNYPTYNDDEKDIKQIRLYDAISDLWHAQNPNQNPRNQRATILEQLEQLRQEFNIPQMYIPQISEEQQRLNRLREENPRQEGESNLQYQIRIAELAEAEEENDKPMGYGECPICMKALTNKQTIVDAHPSANSYYSGHRFHKDCLLGLCNNNKSQVPCPLCREPVNCTHIRNSTTKYSGDNSSNPDNRAILIEERLQGGKRMQRRRSNKKNKKSIGRKSRKGGKRRATKRRKY